MACSVAAPFAAEQVEPATLRRRTLAEKFDVRGEDQRGEDCLANELPAVTGAAAIVSELSHALHVQRPRPEQPLR
jgi:hypothetical protein